MFPSSPAPLHTGSAWWHQGTACLPMVCRYYYLNLWGPSLCQCQLLGDISLSLERPLTQCNDIHLSPTCPSISVHQSSYNPICMGFPYPRACPHHQPIHQSQQHPTRPSTQFQRPQGGKWWPPLTRGCDKCHCVVLDGFLSFLAPAGSWVCSVPIVSVNVVLGGRPAAGPCRSSAQPGRAPLCSDLCSCLGCTLRVLFSRPATSIHTRSNKRVSEASLWRNFLSLHPPILCRTSPCPSLLLENLALKLGH